MNPVYRVISMTAAKTIYQHPSAWKVKDLEAHEHLCEALDKSTLDALQQGLRAASESGVELEDITSAEFPLDKIQENIQRWQDVIQEGRGLLILTGFPVDRFSKEECGAIFYGLGAYLGNAQSQSLMGDRLGHVINVGGKDTRERAYRNSAELSLHTDASDIVGMMCLVQAKSGGISGYSSGPAVYNHLLDHHPELLDVLCEGFYYHLFGEQEPGEQPVTKQKIPVFSEAQGYLSVSYLRSYIELAFDQLGLRKTDLEQRALDTFDQIAHSPEYRFDYLMQPGDIAFFNNYTVLHTRTEFFDHDEPEKKRHLLRLWLKAWQPRPLDQNISTYRERKGIAKQTGGSTYYTGEAEYNESPPPKFQNHNSPGQD
ncbi:MAG: TauD/TfdA family dioxygenase [bacterium]